MLLWLAEESDFYQRTEQLIYQKPDTLHRELLQSRTQSEFWETYQVQRHVEEVATAKAVVTQEGQLVDELFKIKVLYEALGKNVFFRDGNPIDRSVLPYETLKSLEDILYSNTADKAEKGLESQAFRDIVPATASGEVLDKTKAKIAEQIQSLDKRLQDAFAQINLDELGDEQKRFVEHVKQCYSQGTLDSDVLLTVFSSFDKTYQQKVRAEQKAEQRERGWRGQERGRNTSV